MGKLLIKNFLKKNLFQYSVGFILLIISLYLQTLIPKILGLTIDLLKNSNFNKSIIIKYTLIMLTLSICTFIIKYIWRYLIMGASRKLECYLRDSLFEHLEKMPITFFNENKTGDLIAYAVNDISAVRLAFGPAAALLFNIVGLSLFSIFFMSKTINFKLAFYCFIPIPIIILIIIQMGKKIRAKFKTVQERFGNLSDKVQEDINGIRVIKSYVQEASEIDAFNLLNEEMKDANIDMIKTSALLSPIIEICFGISFMINLIYGSNLVKAGVITLGDFVAFNSYLAIIMRPIISIGRFINLTQRAKASFRRLDKVFSSEVDFVYTNQSLHKNDIKGSIEVRDLTFHYPNSNNATLKNISLKINQGKVLGIIGKTGSGKTTLANLLLKLFPIDDNVIFIDDKDLNRMDASTIRENIAYVPQNNFLFSTTIKQNIKFFKEIYSEKEIEDAVKTSLIYDTIENLPDKYDTILGERGLNLSGGQKQRLSIARAIIKDSPILILDDALSALDTKTEKQILKNFKRVMKDKTVIIISNRISSVKNSDEIIVLDEGRIIEKGTHNTLIKNKNFYYQIYKEQYCNSNNKILQEATPNDEVS